MNSWTALTAPTSMRFSARSTKRPTATPSSWRAFTTGLPGSSWSPCSRWRCWPDSATAQLLVAGAIGGLVSRMQRLVFSTRIPITYGSSLGAAVLRAGAWRAGGLGRAGPYLPAAGGGRAPAHRPAHLPDRPSAPSAAVLGIAILLGVSERFLLRLEKQAEAVIDPNRAGPSAQTAPANTSAATQREHLLRSAASPAANATARNNRAA